MKLDCGRSVFECWGVVTLLPSITKSNVTPEKLKDVSGQLKKYVHKNFHPLLTDFTHELKFAKCTIVKNYDSVNLTVSFLVNIPMLPFIKGIKIECVGKTGYGYEDNIKSSSSSLEIYCYGASNKKYFKDRKSYTYLMKSEYEKILSCVIQMAYADSI